MHLDLALMLNRQYHSCSQKYYKPSQSIQYKSKKKCQSKIFSNNCKAKIYSVAYVDVEIREMEELLRPN